MAETVRVWDFGEDDAEFGSAMPTAAAPPDHAAVGSLREVSVTEEAVGHAHASAMVSANDMHMFKDTAMSLTMWSGRGA